MILFCYFALRPTPRPTPDGCATCDRDNNERDVNWSKGAVPFLIGGPRGVPKSSRLCDGQTGIGAEAGSGSQHVATAALRYFSFRSREPAEHFRNSVSA